MGGSESAIQKGTRVLISLWDSLMFGRVPGARDFCGADSPSGGEGELFVFENELRNE